ncbi:MAG: SGNH/GDSL hydrolase family protein [Calditrichaeota bacterium]|nr:SGNH/GDSL hydrolase family protein [Calditrichota bacterium]
MKILNSILIVSLFFVFGCSLDEPGTKVTALSTGNADFSRYVALGNSLTAGYQSGALTEVHQVYSYPAQIAKQAGVAASFAQPLLGYPGIGTYTTSGAGILELKSLVDSEGKVNPSIQPAPYASYPDFNPMSPYSSTEVMTHAAPYNNLGVPGAVTYDLLNATSAATSASGTNSFFDVILRNANPAFGNTTPVQQAGALMPTFVTCWIGNNDVLGYATSGGVSPSSPTDLTIFTALNTQLFDALVAMNADVVVGNIPNVTAIPFFTTVPYAIDPGIGTPLPLWIQTASGVRQATANDYILLTAQSVVATGVGFAENNPLGSQYVLDADEAAVAQTAIDNFNSAIASLASARSIPVIDFNGFFADVAADGYYVGGLEFTTAMVTGGLFSYDGVHPSDLGYAIVANKFIETINAEFNASIPFVNIVDMMGDISPSVNLAKASYQEDALDNVVKLFSGQ